MNYKLTEVQVNNLMNFLDRAPIRGHQERQAMDEICYVLANPIPEPTTEQIEQPPE
jgi:hypothetical protein